MRCRITILVLGFLAVLSGCIEHRPAETVYIAPEPLIENHREPELKGLRVYEGKVRCADCPVVEQRLALKGDTVGIFRLTETYRDASEDGGDEVLVTTGEWKSYRVEEEGTERTIFYLSEGDIHDSTRVQRYEVSDNKIMQRDMDGNPISKPSSYTLRLIRKEL